jgi:hypothetical protein
VLFGQEVATHLAVSESKDQAAIFIDRTRPRLRLWKIKR